MTASARALKEIVLRCRQCGRHAVATRAGQVCATHAGFQGWEVAHLAYMEPSPAAPDLHEGGGQATFMARADAGDAALVARNEWDRPRQQK